MGKFLKKATALFIALIFVYSPVQAVTFTSQLKKAPIKTQSQVSGEILGQAIEMIMEEYEGSDVTVEQLYEAALYGISSELDPYSEYFSVEGMEAFSQQLSNEFYGLGIRYNIDETEQIVVVEVIKDSPASKGGILVGDIIVAINGKSTKGVTIDGLSKMIDDGGQKIEIETKRGAQIFKAYFEKGTVYVNSVVVLSFNDLGVEDALPNSAYVYVSKVADTTGEEFAKVVKALQDAGVKKIILDIRYNGGGYLDQVIQMCEVIVPEGPIIHVNSKEFNMEPINSHLQGKAFEKIVVLVNGGTASAAEVLASAIQESGAGIVVGTQTYGKGVIQSVFSMPFDGAFKLTTEEYFSRNKKKINGIGVIPDVEVEFVDRIYAMDLVLDTEVDGVINLKKSLDMIGFSTGAKTNKVDSQLIKEMKRFQKSVGLTETGILDNVTLVELEERILNYYYENDIALNAAYEELIKD